MTDQDRVSLQLELEDLFSRFSNIYDYFKSIKVGSAVADAKYSLFCELKTSHKNLYARILKFNGSHTEKERVKTNNDAFDDLCVCINAKYNEISKPITQSQTSSSSSLPTLNIPHFDGEIENWSAFKAMFDSVVHSNLNISNTQKLLYLRSFLKNEPLSLISNIDLEDNNYLIAYNILNDRYKSPRRLLNYYLNQVINYKNLENRSYSQFLTTHVNSIQALKSMDIQNLSDGILGFLCYQNLNSHDKQQFDNLVKPGILPSCDDIFNFIKQKAQTFELQNDIKNQTHFLTSIKNSNSKKTAPKKFQAFVSQNNKNVPAISYTLKCCVCSEPHKIYACSKFQNMSVIERIDTIKKLNRCFKCLGYHTKSCTSTAVCKSCSSSNHHSFLHKEKTHDHELPSTSKCNLANVNSHSSVLLSTIEAEIKDNCGLYHRVKCLLDSGSEICAITADCVKKLGLKKEVSFKNILGLSKHTTQVSHAVTCTLSSVTQWRNKVTFNAVIVKEICNKIPTVEPSNDIFNRFKHLPLADNNFHKSSKVDILLGAEVFASILSDKQPNLIKGNPTAIRTTFGYVISGKFHSSNETPVFNSFFLHSAPLEQTMRRFWESEEISSPKKVDPEEIYCEDFFQKTHYRNSDGKYVVRLPFKEVTYPLSSNRPSALKRFINLEKRLISQPDAYLAYKKFFYEYENLSHMKVATSHVDYILPHFAVFKQSSTTAVRAVFDASSVDSNGQSLNSNLCIGPKLQSELPNIIDSFRSHNVVVCCDLVKMYRNVLLDPQDCIHQHIFWRNSSNEEIKEYELQTVTYGMSPSAFLAQRVIQQLVIDEGNPYPLASFSLNNHRFVDDIVSGQDSIENAKQLQNELVEILSKGGFQVKKWSSNRKEILDNFNSEDLEKPLKFSNDEFGIRILGLVWLPEHDSFTYEVLPFNTTSTKRSVLSYISRIYDSNGWLSPVILSAKLFMQRFWLLGLDWDQEIPEPYLSEWENFVQQFPLLSKVNIKRHIFSSNNEFRLIGFCDGSEHGYGSCCYLQSMDNNQCFLLRSKSKVAPIKRLSLPCIELSGALLLVKLVESILTENFPFKIKEIIYYTDSTIVLSWLKLSPHLLKTFVANRVSQIIEKCSPDNWRHVSSSQNCADPVSRGLTPSQLLLHSLYWNGPSSLINNQFIPEDLSNLPEIKQNKKILVGTQNEDMFLTIIEKFSSLTKLQRTIAYVIRFSYNIKHRNTRKHGPLSITELKESLLLCAQSTQRYYFEKELKLIKQNKYSNLPKSFKKLSPFIDSFGTLLVGGRLKNSNLPYISKHPILLPSNCHLAKLICDHFHKLSMHSGATVTQALIQKQWWIFSLRKLLRNRIFSCLQCYKLKAKPPMPYMANLPSPRVQPSKPFTHCGVDFCGFFQVKESQRRNSRIYKAYLCIYICLCTKAAHLEMVSDLSTEAFIASFDRFSSRRSLPQVMYSDCGTNFKGACRELKEIQHWLKDNENEITSSLALRSVTWKFNPPSAPSFGGLWESCVKSTKTLLYRVIGNSILTWEEYTTVFNRIEAVLNSRPLCFLPSSPNDDMDYLSPGHFLVGGPILNFPECIIPENISLKCRWQRIRQMTQAFWKRWSNEYLHTLIQRSKWHDNIKNIDVGQVVMITKENTSPLSWPIGRVVSVHPSADGIVRVVSLKTNNGIKIRPVNKLIPLKTVSE